MSFIQIWFQNFAVRGLGNFIAKSLLFLTPILAWLAFASVLSSVLFRPAYSAASCSSLMDFTAYVRTPHNGMIPFARSYFTSSSIVFADLTLHRTKPMMTMIQMPSAPPKMYTQSKSASDSSIELKKHIVRFHRNTLQNK